MASYYRIHLAIMKMEADPDMEGHFAKWHCAGRVYGYCWGSEPQQCEKYTWDVGVADTICHFAIYISSISEDVKGTLEIEAPAYCDLRKSGGDPFDEAVEAVKILKLEIVSGHRYSQCSEFDIVRRDPGGKPVDERFRIKGKVVVREDEADVNAHFSLRKGNHA